MKCSPICRPAMRRPRHRGGADGRGGGRKLQPDARRRISTRWSAYVRSVPAVASSDLPATHRAAGAGFAQRPALRSRMLSARKYSRRPASVAITGPASARISPYATIAGARAVNDPTATNVAQIVISGTDAAHAGGCGLDAGVRQHLFRYGNRGRGELRHRALRQREVRDCRKRHCGAAAANLTLEAAADFVATPRSVRGVATP